MIDRVTIRNFKLFQEETFILDDTIVLSGPNNSGKSTVLQAMASWSMAFSKWNSSKGDSEAMIRKGAVITRKDFTAIPLREYKLLWKDKDTHFKKVEGKKPGSPRHISIELSWNQPLSEKIESKPMKLAMNFRYESTETIYVYPEINLKDEESKNIIKDAEQINIVHIPPFSGIGAEEPRRDRGLQNKFIGEGKPGDILRNLLLEVYLNSPDDDWQELVELGQKLFGLQLLPPSYVQLHDAFITCEYEYKKGKERVSLDIASAGTGVHQVMLLFSFFFARPSSVLLMDEPDAHLHVRLQGDVLDLLRRTARKRGCQVIIATHSEVILNSTAPERIISFYRTPHKLVSDTERDQVREALKRVTSLDLLLAEQSNSVLYLESETDFKILREFALLLDHPARKFFESGLWHSNNGRDPQEVKAHLFALCAIKPEIKGLLLLDRDYRDLPEHEISASGLAIGRWRRYEIENYLLIPQALIRFCESSTEKMELFQATAKEKARQWLEDHFPKAELHDPLLDTDFLINARASKSILPALFDFAGVSISKPDYFQIVSSLKPEEIHPEIIEKLDAITELIE